MKVKGRLISFMPDRFRALNDTSNVFYATVQLEKKFIFFRYTKTHRVEIPNTVNMSEYAGKNVILKLA